MRSSGSKMRVRSEGRGMRIEIARVRPRWAVGLLQLLLPLAVWAQLVHAAPVLYEGGRLGRGSRASC